MLEYFHWNFQPKFDSSNIITQGPCTVDTWKVTQTGHNATYLTHTNHSWHAWKLYWANHSQHLCWLSVCTSVLSDKWWASCAGHSHSFWQGVDTHDHINYIISGVFWWCWGVPCPFASRWSPYAPYDDQNAYLPEREFLPNTLEYITWVPKLGSNTFCVLLDHPHFWIKLIMYMNATHSRWLEHDASATPESMVVCWWLGWFFNWGVVWLTIVFLGLVDHVKVCAQHHSDDQQSAGLLWFVTTINNA